jgi:hypothetical protein
MDTVNDKELINMMKQATERLCDEAIDKWKSGQYTDDKEEIRININLWKEKKIRVGELCEIFKNNKLS